MGSDWANEKDAYAIMKPAMIKIKIFFLYFIGIPLQYLHVKIVSPSCYLIRFITTNTMKTTRPKIM